MMMHKAAPATMMAVRILRSCVGASSLLNQRFQSESSGRASRNVALTKLFRRRTFDDRDRGRPHAEKILVGIFDFDTDRESLRDAHPVQFALHIRHAGGREIDLAFGLHCPSDALNFYARASAR